MPIKYLLNGKEINLTSDNTVISSTNFSVDKNGNMSCNNANINSATLNNGDLKILTDGTVHIKDSTDYDNARFVCDSYDEDLRTIQTSQGFWANRYSDDTCTQVTSDGIITTGDIDCTKVYQSSLESKKKNFEKLENGLDIVKATEIYKYHFKSQEDTDKKQIGFVIGDNYKYSEEITSQNNDGVDTYSMISVAYKAIQEQQELIEQLQNEIKELKGEK